MSRSRASAKSVFNSALGLAPLSLGTRQTSVETRTMKQDVTLIDADFTDFAVTPHEEDLLAPAARLDLSLWSPPKFGPFPTSAG